MNQLDLFSFSREPSHPTSRHVTSFPSATAPAASFLRHLRTWVYDHPGYVAGDIARFLGLRHESVAAALMELERKGLVRQQRDRVGIRWKPVVEVIDLSRWAA